MSLVQDPWPDRGVCPTCEDPDCLGSEACDENNLSRGVQAGTRPGQNSPLDTDCLRDNRDRETVSISKEGATRNSGSSAPPAQPLCLQKPAPSDGANSGVCNPTGRGSLSQPDCETQSLT